MLTQFAKAIEDEELTARQLRELDRGVQKATGALLAVKLVAETMVKTVPRPRQVMD